MKGGLTIFTKIFIAFLLLAILPVTVSSILVVSTYDELVTSLIDILTQCQDPDQILHGYALVRDATVLVAMTLFITIVITIFASLFISRNMGVPIRNMLQTIGMAAKGNLDVRAQVRTRDEFGLLARGFNMMIRQLEQYQSRLEDANRNLEARVAERTAELSIAYEKLKTSADKIHEANRLKTEFVANMSHELRTPLNSIIGYTELSLEGLYGPLEPKQEEALTKIKRNSRQLLRLISGVLDLSKIEAGKMPLYLETFDAMELIRDVADDLFPLFEKKSLKLIVQSTGHIPPLKQDHEKLQHVLMNLLSNALKFTDKGMVRVVAGEEPATRTVRIDVIDTGIGIPDDQYDAVFEHFRQIDGGTTRKRGGTGLGLALVKQLVEHMGGTITLTSKLGEGSRFTVRLPIKYHSPGEQYDGPPKPIILAVDDDAKTLADLDEWLSAEGFEVIRCRDGRDALKKADSVSPKLILLDTLLPYMDGWSILEQLKDKSSTKDIPVIMMSELVEKSEELLEKASNFIKKPFLRDQIVEMIRGFEL